MKYGLNHYILKSYSSILGARGYMLNRFCQYSGHFWHLLVSASSPYWENVMKFGVHPKNVVVMQGVKVPEVWAFTSQDTGYIFSLNIIH